MFCEVAYSISVFKSSRKRNSSKVTNEKNVVLKWRSNDDNESQQNPISEDAGRRIDVRRKSF